MNVQGIQITDVTKAPFLEKVCLVLHTKEVVPFVGPALSQVKPAKKEGNFRPNIDQRASFLGVRVRDGNRGLKFTRCKRIVPLAEEFCDDRCVVSSMCCLRARWC